MVFRGKNSCCSSFFPTLIWVVDFHTNSCSACRNQLKSQPIQAHSTSFHYSTHCPCNVVCANSRYVHVWLVVLEKNLLELETPCSRFCPISESTQNRPLCHFFVVPPFFLHLYRCLLMSTNVSTNQNLPPVIWMCICSSGTRHMLISLHMARIAMMMMKLSRHANEPRVENSVITSSFNICIQIEVVIHLETWPSPYRWALKNIKNAAKCKSRKHTARPGRKQKP